MKFCKPLVQKPCIYTEEKILLKFSVENDFTYGIGPGLGTDYETEEKLMHFLKNYNEPLVLDADALNLISKNSENLNLIPKINYYASS